MKGVFTMKMLTKLWNVMCAHKIVTVIVLGFFLGVICAVDMVMIEKPIPSIYGTITFEKWMAYSHCFGMGALIGVVNGLVLTH